MILKIIMLETLYLRFKRVLPPGLRSVLSSINQRIFARHTLRRKYGAWFDPDWRKKYQTLSDEEWIRAYDEVWKYHHNDCVDETDTAMIVRVLRSPAQAGTVSSVLEVGCGAGSLAIGLARSGFDVSCIDVSVEALRQAEERSLAEGVRISWHSGFAERLPFPDKSFDAVTCCHTLEHVRDLDAAVAELKRVARHCVAVVVPRQEYRLYAGNYHTQFFTSPDDLVKVFALSRYEARELDYLGRNNEFQDRALLYVGYCS